MGNNDCTATANSTGSSAVISATGALDPFANTVALQVEFLPAKQPGILSCGPAQVSLPFGNGVRSVDGGGSIFTNVPMPFLRSAIRGSSNPSSRFDFAGVGVIQGFVPC